MPVDYKIEADKRLVIVRYYGHLKLEEVIAIRQKGASDPDFDPAYNIIDDISAVESSDINYEMIQRVAAQSVAKKGVRRALIVQTDLQRGMAKIYKVLSESVGHHFEIFEDYKAGMDWVMGSESE